MKRLFFLTACLVSFCCLFPSCSNTGDSSEEQCIVVILRGDNAYWDQLENSIEFEAYQLNYTPIFATVSNSNIITSQLSAIEGLYAIDNVKGVIIAPEWTDTDHRVEQALLQYYNATYVPIVLIDTPIDPMNSPIKPICRAFVGTNNTEAGEDFQSAVGPMIGSGKEVLIVKEEDSVPASERYWSILSRSSYSNIHLLDTSPSSVSTDLPSKLSSLPSVNDMMILNGPLMDRIANLSCISGKNIYTFDIMSSAVTSLSEGKEVKFIMAQNTVDMGAKAVQALFNPSTENNIYVDPISIDASNINSPSIQQFIDLVL